MLFTPRGTIISGSPGSPAAVLAFERNGGFPNDFNSVPGTGRDVSGDGFTDTFNMTEPLAAERSADIAGPRLPVRRRHGRLHEFVDTHDGPRRSVSGQSTVVRAIQFFQGTGDRGGRRDVGSPHVRIAEQQSDSPQSRLFRLPQLQQGTTESRRRPVVYGGRREDVPLSDGVD